MSDKLASQCCLIPHERHDLGRLKLKQHVGWQVETFSVPDDWGGGKDIVVAVLDTGCDLSHPDLDSNLVAGFNCLSSDPPEDDNDHGTHIAGTICAENNELGVVGVAPLAKVMPVKVLDEAGYGEPDVIAEGVAAALSGRCDVISMSFGCTKRIPPLRLAIRDAARRGVPVICSGGNASRDLDATYPARYADSVAVAACDDKFTRAAFANARKHRLDFLAPGIDIVSTARGGGYAVMTGSSMAAAVAAGWAALLLGASRAGLVERIRTVADFREALGKHFQRLREVPR